MSFPILHFCTALLHCTPTASLPSSVLQSRWQLVHSAFPAYSSSSTKGFGARPCIGLQAPARVSKRSHASLDIWCRDNLYACRCSRPACSTPALPSTSPARA